MITTHARKRCTGRAIPLSVLELLQSYGREIRTHGCSKFYLDKSSRRQLVRDLGGEAVQHLGHKLDAYVVVTDDGWTVTAAYRTKRIHRH